MRSVALALAVVCVALAATPVMAGWVVPGPVVVQSYYPVGPVYAYPAPAPVVTAYPPAAVMVPAPGYVVPGPVVAPAGVWIGPRGRVRGVWW